MRRFIVSNINFEITRLPPMELQKTWNFFLERERASQEIDVLRSCPIHTLCIARGIDGHRMQIDNRHAPVV